jgi:hypothetical protein
LPFYSGAKLHQQVGNIMHNWKYERLTDERTRALLQQRDKAQFMFAATAHEHNTPSRPLLVNPVKWMFEPGMTPDN